MCHKKTPRDSFRFDNGKTLLLTHVMNENGTYTACDRHRRLKLSPEPSSSAEQERAYFFQKFSIIYFFAMNILLKSVSICPCKIIISLLLFVIIFISQKFFWICSYQLFSWLSPDMVATKVSLGAMHD